MYYAPMPFPVMALLIIAFICYMHKTRPKPKPKSKSNPYDDLMECVTRDLTPQERENISVMKKLVAQY